MTLTRRHMIAGLAGLGGAGLAAAGLGGCARDRLPHNPVNSSYDAEVIILGAGLAGLYAARLLSDAGQDVLVLEANDRVGGRIFTLPHKIGFTEGGAARFAADHRRVNKVAAELGISFDPINAAPSPTSYWLNGRAVEAVDWQAAVVPNQKTLYPHRATDLHIAGGAQRFPDAIANGLPRQPILKTYIQAIHQTGSEISAVDHKGRIWRAPKMICALPFGALRHLDVNVPLAALQKTAIARLPYAQNLQVHFRAKTPFWEKDNFGMDMQTDGIIGQLRAQYDAAGAPNGLFQSRLNDDAIKVLFQSGTQHLHRQFRAELARLRPSTYAAIEIFNIVNWTSDNRAAGGAAMRWTDAQKSNWADIMGRPSERLYFIGAHLGREHSGMEGAMESAEQVVQALTV